MAHRPVPLDAVFDLDAMILGVLVMSLGMSLPVLGMVVTAIVSVNLR